MDENIQDNRGFTPLHLSARLGNENLCRLLLEHNVDVNIQDNRGFTPLHWCTLGGNENICRLLLEHNADVNIPDIYGYTFLHLCAREGNENLRRLLLKPNAMQQRPKFELSFAQKSYRNKLYNSCRFRSRCRKTQVQSQIGENTEAKPLVYAYNILMV